MIRFITLLACWFCLLPAKGQFPAHPDSIFTFIRYNSVWSNKIQDWAPVHSSFRKQLEAARNMEDTMNSFIRVLEQLNDVHSYFIYRGKFYGYYQPLDSARHARIRPVLSQANQETDRFTTSFLPGRIAYVRVPAIQAYGADDVNRYARQLYDSVAQYIARKPKGFIVDLRLNSGGNMYPMLAGLGELLGNTVIGYETDRDGKPARKWELVKGNLVSGGYPVTGISAAEKSSLEQIPVAVLTGPVTASSGTMTAIAFKQRPRTIFIGEPTAEGYSTSNGYFTYGNTLIFLFATNFVADRKLQLYTSSVPVDILVTGRDDFYELLRDDKIKTALQWLRKRKTDTAR